jgi:hypothetical protein
MKEMTKFLRSDEYGCNIMDADIRVELGTEAGDSTNTKVVITSSAFSDGRLHVTTKEKGFAIEVNGTMERDAIRKIFADVASMIKSEV